MGHHECSLQDYRECKKLLKCLFEQLTVTKICQISYLAIECQIVKD